MNITNLKNICRSVFVLISFSTFSQEVIRPLRTNLNYIYEDLMVEKKLPVQVASKTQSVSLNIPFIDDFYYAPTSPYPDQNKWSDFQVYVNSGFPIAPPSIGVATFDGLNAYGYPYYPTLTNNQVSRSADTLTSRAINLLTTAASQTLQIVDSLALSFYYQARGNGDPPEPTDSLVLEFYKPAQDVWDTTVWFATGNINGNINDTVFKRGFVWISDTAFLHDGFQFRFRSLSSGNRQL